MLLSLFLSTSARTVDPAEYKWYVYKAPRATNVQNATRAERIANGSLFGLKQRGKTFSLALQNGVTFKLDENVAQKLIDKSEPRRGRAPAIKLEEKEQRVTSVKQSQVVEKRTQGRNIEAPAETGMIDGRTVAAMMRKGGYNYDTFNITQFKKLIADLGPKTAKQVQDIVVAQLNRKQRERIANNIAAMTLTQIRQFAKGKDAKPSTRSGDIKAPVATGTKVTATKREVPNVVNKKRAPIDGRKLAAVARRANVDLDVVTLAGFKKLAKIARELDIPITGLADAVALRLIKAGRAKVAQSIDDFVASSPNAGNTRVTKTNAVKVPESKTQRGAGGGRRVKLDVRPINNALGGHTVKIRPSSFTDPAWDSMFDPDNFADDDDLIDTQPISMDELRVSASDKQKLRIRVVKL